MGKRYRHVMARVRGQAHPAVLVGLSCDTHLEPVAGRAALERLVLDRWYAAYVTTSKNTPTVEREITSTTVSEWWRWLHAVAQVNGTVLVCSLGAMSHLSLLGFWEGLEDGRIRLLAGKDSGEDNDSGGLPHREDASGDARSARQLHGSPGVSAMRSGFLVTEDPPTIAYFWIRECRSLIRWNDIRNYGISESGLPAGGPMLASSIARTLGSMSRELTGRKLGGLKDTAASQSLYSFRRKHMRNAILCHTVGEVLKLEADAYYSGRCECQRIGYIDGPVYELDFRGAYTYTMLHVPVPCRLRSYTLAPGAGEVPGFGNERGMVASVLLRTEQPDYPYRKDGLTIWPTGVMRTTLCGPELYDALEKGRILKWYAWAEYDLEPALSGFAQETYDLRVMAEDQEDKPLAQWAKAVAVALVGKLGQRGREWEWRPEMLPRYWYDQYYQRDPDHAVRRYQEIAGHHRREILSGWGPDSVPAIAGWITSAARMRLLSAIRVAGCNNCLYYDTDSIFCNTTGFQRLTAAGWIREGELGFLQLKGCHAWMELRGIKNYSTPELCHMAGIPGSGKTSVLSAERYKTSLWLSTYLTMGSRPESLVKDSSQTRVQPYLHGTLMAGGRVEPLIVQDL